MEMEKLIRLIEAVSASELTSFKFEEKGTRISMGKQEKQIIIERNTAVPVQYPSAGAGSIPVGGGAAEAVQTVIGNVSEAAQISTKNAAAQEAQETGADAETAKGSIVKSPLVGTFYAAPSEDAKPFVRVGDAVKTGQPLAIVEAMKLMNEIESEFDGTVAEIYVANGETVEYGQPLFRIV